MGILQKSSRELIKIRFRGSMIKRMRSQTAFIEVYSCIEILTLHAIVAQRLELLGWSHVCSDLTTLGKKAPTKLKRGMQLHVAVAIATCSHDFDHVTQDRTIALPTVLEKYTHREDGSQANLEAITEDFQRQNSKTTSRDKTELIFKDRFLLQSQINFGQCRRNSVLAQVVKIWPKLTKQQVHHAGRRLVAQNLRRQRGRTIDSK